MAIAFDASSNGAQTTLATLTWSHTCTGSGKLLCVSVDNQNTDTVTGVTYAGVAMIQTGKIKHNGSNEYTYMYHLLSPTSGANNIIVSRSTTGDTLSAVASSYTGVAGLDASATGDAVTSPMTLTVVTVVNNCWVVAAGGGANSALAAGTGMTGRAFTTGAVGIGDSNAAITPAGSTNIAFTGGGTINFGGVVASFLPSVPSNQTGSETITMSEQIGLTFQPQVETITVSDTGTQKRGWNNQSKSSTSWVNRTKL